MPQDRRRARGSDIQMNGLNAGVFRPRVERLAEKLPPLSSRDHKWRHKVPCRLLFSHAIEGAGWRIHRTQTDACHPSAWCGRQRIPSSCGIFIT
jgi:hypothetical protein